MHKGWVIFCSYAALCVGINYLEFTLEPNVWMVYDHTLKNCTFISDARVLQDMTVAPNTTVVHVNWYTRRSIMLLEHMNDFVRNVAGWVVGFTRLWRIFTGCFLDVFLFAVELVFPPLRYRDGLVFDN